MNVDQAEPEAANPGNVLFEPEIYAQQNQEYDDAVAEAQSTNTNMGGAH